MTLVKRVWQEPSAFTALAAAWERLVEESAFPTPFMTPAWHAVWWHHFPEGELHLVGWFENDMLVGLASFHLADQRAQCCLRPVGGVEVADYLDILAVRGYEEQIAAALLDHLFSPEAPSWEEILLVNLPEHTPTHRVLPQLARTRGLWTWVDVEDVCPVIPLPNTFEEYLYMLNKKQRHEVRRKRRRLMEAARTVRYHVVRPDEDLDHAMDMFISLHRRSDPHKAAFMTAQMEAFFRDIARLARERGWLHLAFLEVDEQPVATLLCFDYRERRMVYNSGFDPETAPRTAPGVNLVVMDIEQAIATGLKIFDFLQGDEEYKFRLGAQPSYVYRVRIRRDAPPVEEAAGKTSSLQAKPSPAT